MCLANYLPKEFKKLKAENSKVMQVEKIKFEETQEEKKILDFEEILRE